MKKIIRLTKTQAAKVRRQIRASCCNYYEGNCLLLDERYEPCPCVQMITQSLICKWYRCAVLPGDKSLNSEILLQKGGKLCAECGTPFYPLSNGAKYCEACSAAVKKRKTAARQKRYRQNHSS